MAISDLIGRIKSNKRLYTALKIFLTALICLIFMTYVFDSGKSSPEPQEAVSDEISINEYRAETERRLTEFLKEIEGVGDVKVYLNFRSEQEYVYAREGRTSVSENKKEEECKYVMIGKGSDKTALVETINLPKLDGAVIACTGSENAAVCSKVYKAASAALGVPTSCIYVTKLR